jgi:hypothetical protein
MPRSAKALSVRVPTRLASACSTWMESGCENDGNDVNPADPHSAVRLPELHLHLIRKETVSDTF